MLTWQYILSQIFVILAMITMGITFLVKNKIVILGFSTLSVLCFALEFLFLGSITGMIVNFISVFRGIWFFYNEKKDKPKDYLSLIVISLALSIAGCLAAKIWIDYLAVVATVLYTYAIWQKKISVYRYLAVIGSIFWIIYNVIYYSVIGLICEICLLIFELIGVIMLYKNNNKYLNTEKM